MEHLSGQWEALNSNSSVAKKKKENYYSTFKQGNRAMSREQEGMKRSYKSVSYNEWLKEQRKVSPVKREEGRHTI
jgi:hypothetical protein